MRRATSTRPDGATRAWIPYFVLLATLLLTAAATFSVRRNAEAKDHLRFDNAVQATRDDIQNRLDTYISLLRSTSGLFAAEADVSRQDFHAYIERLELREHYPGIQGIGFSVLVKPEEKDALVAAMRRQGVDEFEINPNTARGEYHSIIYLEPLDRRNRAAIGFDMFTELVRRAAMERARDTGAPAASGRVTLRQEIDEKKQAGFLLYVPIYRHGVAANTTDERREALQGFVYSPFRADDLLAGIFGAQPHPYVDFRVYDGDAQGAENLLHDARLTNAAAVNPSPRFTNTLTIEIAGRRWTLAFASRPELELESGSGQASYILLGGLLISAIFFALARAQAQARAAAEAAASNLRQSEARFRTLVEQSPLSTQIFSPDGYTLQVNRAWEQLWGVTLETLGDYNVLKDAQLVEKGIMPYIKQGFAGTPTAIPPMLYDPDVSIPDITVNDNPQRWVQAIIYPVKDEAGEIREVVLVHEDITERKREEERRARRARQTTLRAEVSIALAGSESLRSILHESAEALVRHFGAAFARIWTLDADTNVLVLEASAGLYTHLDGAHARVPVGQFKIGLIAGERKPHLTNDVAHDPRVSDPAWARREGMIAFAGYPLLVEDKLIGVMAMFSRERLTEETLESLALVAETIAQGIERKRLEEQLRLRAEQLAEANRLKDQFLATLSHELRTPLTSILGWAKLMRTENFDPRLSARALEIIERNAVAQSELINDLLDVSRIITGKLRLAVQPVEPAPLIAAAVDSLRPAADARGVNLEMQLDATTGPVSGDPDRLQQIIWNLLSNAVKFTPERGRVTVRLRRLNAHVEVSVEDTGQGISAEFLPYIFDRFRQADGSITREHGGLGLGLSIVRQLVELHGGTIRAESPGPDQGATFRVTLPLTTPGDGTQRK